ncbi:MAG: AtpZ/AtpI family protein [Spirochaetia bacterium]|nr:AtpZ/AtpI family protein [Spirochaetia bacterium]
MKGGGFLGIGFEFIGIAGLFTAAGIYLDGRWGGHGLILVGLISVGVAAGIWHMIRRVQTLNQEMKFTASNRPAPKLSPEENLKRMDQLNQEISEMADRGAKKAKKDES